MDSRESSNIPPKKTVSDDAPRIHALGHSSLCSCDECRSRFKEEVSLRAYITVDISEQLYPNYKETEKKLYEEMKDMIADKYPDALVSGQTTDEYGPMLSIVEADKKKMTVLIEKDRQQHNVVWGSPTQKALFNMRARNFK